MKNKFAKRRDARETMRRVLLILGSMMPRVGSSEMPLRDEKGQMETRSLSRGRR